jgi:predicted RNA binding protein YcfA (HicA-like mRNA interferase family)
LGKRRVLSGKHVCAILSEHGFADVRQRGSHIIMQKRVGNSTITVPVPNHRELAPRHAGIDYPPVEIAAFALRVLTGGNFP